MLDSKLVAQIQNNEITQLQLSNTKLTSEDIIELASLLEKNISIFNLELWRTNIDDGGATALASMLEINSSIHYFDFSDNKIGYAGIKALAQMLEKSSSIHSFYLSGNNIGDAEATALAEALKKNSSIRSFNLSGNDIGDTGAIALAEALKKNSSIHSLCLSRNNIGDTGATALASMLEINSSIHSFDLSSNNVRAEGAEALAKALKKNSSIHSFDLGSNEIGDNGAISLAQMLEKNSSIHTLNLIFNKIGNTGVKALASMLEINNSIHSFDLSGNNIGDAEARVLAKKIEYNYVILDIKIWKINNFLIKKYTTRNEDLLEKAVEKAISYLSDTSKEHNFSSIDILTLTSHKQIVKDKLGKYKIESSKLWELLDSTNYEALKPILFDLLGFPFKLNAATSLFNTKNTEEYKKLYELFKDNKDQALLEKLQNLYNKLENNIENPNLVNLWNEFIDYAAKTYQWSEDKIESIKALDIDGKHSKNDVMNSILFHSLFPHYSDITCIIEQCLPEIEQALMETNIDQSVLSITKLLSDIILPSATKTKLNQALSELKGKRPELFKQENEAAKIKEDRYEDNVKYETPEEALQNQSEVDASGQDSLIDPSSDLS